MAVAVPGQRCRQFLILLAIVTAGLRHRGDKRLIGETGQRQILQQMADPLAAGVKPQAQRRGGVDIAGDKGQPQVGPEGF